MHAAAVLTQHFLLSPQAVVRPSPEAMGFAPTHENPHRVVGKRAAKAAGAAGRPIATRDILRELCASAEFWTVAALSVCCTTMREAINTNSADVLRLQGASPGPSDFASWSELLPRVIPKPRQLLNRLLG